MLSTRWFVVVALLALVPSWVLAQGGASALTASPTDPLNADATVPAIATPRIFDSYHVYHDTGPLPWCEINAAVSPQPGGTAYDSYAGHSLPASAPSVPSNEPAGESVPGVHHY